MGATSSRSSGPDDPKQAIFPDTVVQRFSFYGVIVCLLVSIATFLWVATNAAKWNQRGSLTI
jgi:hypothetical protein